MAYQPPFPPSSTPPYETSTLLPPSHPSPYAELPRTDRALQYPPSYYGPIQTPLPILPANLADFRDGKYAWRYSWVDHDIRFGALGFAVACFDRGFAHRTMLPFQRGIMAWQKHFWWTVSFIGISHAFQYGLNLYSQQADVRLEVLRRLRAKSVEQVRMEAQRSLEGLPADYPLREMERDVPDPRDPRVTKAAEEAAGAFYGY